MTANFQHILHFFLVFLLLTLHKQMVAGQYQYFEHIQIDLFIVVARKAKFHLKELQSSNTRMSLNTLDVGLSV